MPVLRHVTIDGAVARCGDHELRIPDVARRIRALGEEQPLRADVVILNGYSAHADRTELARWLGGVHAKSPALRTVYLVHGEPVAQDALRAQLASAGYTVEAPAPRTRIAL